MTIAEALIRLLKEEGLNNMTFAQTLGMSHGATSRYLHGSRVPPLNRLKQIARVFNRRLDLVIEDDNIKGRFEFRDQKRNQTFDEKIEQCRPALMNYAISRMHLQKNNADDLVQDTILKGLLLHYSWNPEVAMTTWLIGIMKRSRSKFNSRLIYVANYLETEILTDEVEDVFRKNVKLFHYIEGLSKKDREFFKYYANGIAYKEIALVMNTSENYVKVRIQTIKKLISRKIEKDTPCNSQ